MFTDLNQLPSLKWMPSRIPVRDALVAFVPEETKPPEPPFSSGETRWYPVPGGLRKVVPYDGQPIDAPEFHFEKGLWDHTTCDCCNARIAAMELCYVTARGQYEALCIICYKKHVVAKVGTIRALIWKLKHMVGTHAAV